ncbi:vitamin K-dependent gamma-carboxylase-like isoform X2 [Paramacrobiotus metropolitanus]|uniref:vitamin K-dependent gamma-carboxylase-like isoform X2 n=1 Tax=Paramacrobiotus metropolitanus TaxID=2943436 RepID=UPI00244634FD|nr:vitamin K-dependent gamma-carboxylase-like isoform X2 [Paramacrobiotus metropolitanus]
MLNTITAIIYISRKCISACTTVSDPGHCLHSNNAEHKKMRFGLIHCRTNRLSIRELFIRSLFQACPEASLRWIRRSFGLLMVGDTLTERGMLNPSALWGPQVRCHFPLLPFMPFPTLNGFKALYSVMLLSTLGITVEFKTSVCTTLYCLTFWYVYCLDISLWNHHSYLFGLIAFLFVLSANLREKLPFPVDGEHYTVPNWIYHLLRFQVFIVYFFAGLKKWDVDWLKGYSVSGMSENWAFFPLRLMLGKASVDLYFIHWIGFAFDLSVGFFLFWRRTRAYAYAVCCAFHFLNCTVFEIGMFPYAMIVLSLIFFPPCWPVDLHVRLRRWLEILIPMHLLWGKIPVMRYQVFCRKPIERLQKPSCKPVRKYALGLIISSYVCIQIFLPFSHIVFQGCNTWTNSLYGYSWDMMVQQWQIQHVKITLEDRSSAHSIQRRSLKPDIWTANNRFSYQAYLAKQLAECIAKRLTASPKANTSSHSQTLAVYFDVWIAMNGGFKQRIFRPDVDLVTAPWSLFSPVDWVLPQIMNRTAFDRLTNELTASKRTIHPNVTLVYVADFPGYSLQQYIPENFGRVTLDVLKGTVNVTVPSSSIVSGSTTNISPNGSAFLPDNATSVVTVAGSEPAIYLLSSI